MTKGPRVLHPWQCAFNLLFLLCPDNQGKLEQATQVVFLSLVYIPQSVPSLWSHYREHLRDRTCSPPVCAPVGWSWLLAAHHRQRRMLADLSPAPWNAGRADCWRSFRWRKRHSLWSCVRGCGLLASASLGPRRGTRQSLRRSFGSTDIVSWVQHFTLYFGHVQEP